MVAPGPWNLRQQSVGFALPDHSGANCHGSSSTLQRGAGHSSRAHSKKFKHALSVTFRRSSATISAGHARSRSVMVKQYADKRIRRSPRTFRHKRLRWLYVSPRNRTVNSSEGTVRKVVVAAAVVGALAVTGGARCEWMGDQQHPPRSSRVSALSSKGNRGRQGPQGPQGPQGARGSRRTRGIAGAAGSARAVATINADRTQDIGVTSRGVTGVAHTANSGDCCIGLAAGISPDNAMATLTDDSLAGAEVFTYRRHPELRLGAG